MIYFYRIAHFLYKLKIPLLPKIIYYLQFLLFNSSVPPSVEIGKGTKFAYGGIGVVIHARAKIGNNCVVGAGSLVLKSIPSNTVSWGSPCKVKRKLRKYSLIKPRFMLFMMVKL